MGYIFAASILDLIHVGLITLLVQAVLFWMGLRFMSAFSPLFDKVKPWLIASVLLQALSMFGYTGEHTTLTFRSIPLFGIVQTLVGLWFWYLLLRAIRSLEAVYGDLHSGMLFKLYYVRIGLAVATYVIFLVALYYPKVVVPVTILYTAATILVTILHLVYLYRAWQDFQLRDRQLRENQPIEEVKR